MKERKLDRKDRMEETEGKYLNHNPLIPIHRRSRSPVFFLPKPFYFFSFLNFFFFTTHYFGFWISAEKFSFFFFL
jgi:hypothetical protein